MEGGREEKLLLLFTAGDDLYACDAEPIIEIVPKVKLKEIPQAPEAVAGLLNFGGQPIPVIDFCQLVKKKQATPSLHTRIILFSNPNTDDKQLTTLGLIAEVVTETTRLDLFEFVDAGMRIMTLPYLGGVLNSQDETVQFVMIDVLFDAMKDIAVYS